MTCLYKVSNPQLCSYTDCRNRGRCQYSDYNDYHIIRPSKEPVPVEIDELVTRINKALTKGYQLEAYLQGCSEGPDEWLLRILHQDEGEVVRNLRPHAVDWHTLMLMLDARFRWGAHQFNQGKLFAIGMIADQFKTIVGAK